jgi:hypothetical protein
MLQIMRKIFATLVVALLAVGAIGEAAPKTGEAAPKAGVPAPKSTTAAPKTSVRHRPRHSSRVATGAAANKKKPPKPPKPRKSAHAKSGQKQKSVPKPE